MKEGFIYLKIIIRKKQKEVLVKGISHSDKTKTIQMNLVRGNKNISTVEKWASCT